MTRSVEIPDSALDAARQAFRQVPSWSGPDMAMRAALLAALPYLVPAASRERAAQRMWELHAQEQSWEELSDLGKDQMRSEADEVLRFAGIRFAPAGDGGLREALEASARDKIAEWYGSEWNASEDKFYETYDGGGISCVDEEAMLELRGVRLALDLALAAHPAAPAVPQPVDREALARILDPDIFDETIPRSKREVAQIQIAARQHMAYQGADRLLATGVVMAVLAGEQE